MYIRPQQRRLVLLATTVAITLIVASIIIAVQRTPAPAPPDSAEEQTKTTVRPVEARDHVFGNPGAPIVFVTYSDFLCPYCKEFYTTMKKVIETYGKDGQVAWAYRHMPITRLHPHAATYALASECVAQYAGTKGFWSFADLLHATSSTERVLTSTELITLAETTGVSSENFTTCMKDGSLMRHVEGDFSDAIRAGASATPFTVIVTAYQQLPRQGARPYPVVASTVEAMLRNLGALTQKPTTELLPNLFEDVLEEAENQTIEGTPLEAGESIE
jgi:protein-disulfide isomerase